MPFGTSCGTPSVRVRIRVRGGGRGKVKVRCIDVVERAY